MPTDFHSEMCSSREIKKMEHTEKINRRSRDLRFAKIYLEV